MHILDGNAPDLDAECKRYEKQIAEAGGIELFLAGIGPDGHIAFNEPGSSLSSRTRVKTLAQETVVANARFFGGELSAVPRMALTVGVATVLDAKEVLVIITGTHKAYALAKCIEEGVNHMFTVSAIQMHPKAVVVCDEDATLELRVRREVLQVAPAPRGAPRRAGSRHAHRQEEKAVVPLEQYGRRRLKLL